MAAAEHTSGGAQRKPTFADEIEAEAAHHGETVETVVIGTFGGGGYREDERAVPPNKTGVPLAWGEGRPLLDYAYDPGYGAPDCHAVAAYTRTHVLFVSQYDGATSVESMRRDPAPFEPSMPGG
jgi:hypothetical protein